jgi:hypothetical protein
VAVVTSNVQNPGGVRPPGSNVIFFAHSKLNVKIVGVTLITPLNVTPTDFNVNILLMLSMFTNLYWFLTLKLGLLISF